LDAAHGYSDGTTCEVAWVHRPHRGRREPQGTRNVAGGRNGRWRPV